MAPNCNILVVPPSKSHEFGHPKFVRQQSCVALGNGAIQFLLRCALFTTGAVLLVTLPGCQVREPTREPATPMLKVAPIVASNDRRPTTNPETRVGNATQPVLPDDWFEDVTPASGIDFVYRNGREGGHFYILESLGGGAALFDYDRDGDVEVFLTGGGTIDVSPPRIGGLPSALFRNEGGLRFSSVTASAGLDVPGDYSHGCIIADYDTDGYADVLVTAYGRCRLFRNQGDGTFDEVATVAGLETPGWWTAAAWGDVDQDGLADLFVTGYLKWSPETDQPCWNATRQREVCSPTRYPAANDRLYRNRGDGAFEDVSTRTGLQPGGNGLGVVAADINGDGRVDFYVANDESDKFLYFGRPAAKLEEVAHSACVAVNQYGTHEGSMGVEVGDYDGDSRADLWVTNFELEDNALYRNLGEELFSQTTNTAGLAGHSRLHVGFGTALDDFDGDGWLDLLVINGHVFYGGGQLPYRQKSQLFRNRANGRFEDVSLVGGSYFRADHPGRGAAVGDLDNDGGLDLVVVHQNEPVSILRNRLPSRHFVSLEVIGTQVDRDAVGSVISISSERGNRVHFLRSGAGYLSQFDRRIMVSVSTETVDVEVRWAGGSTELFRKVPTGHTHALIQGRGIANVTP